MKKLALALLASLALSTGAQALETGVAPKVTELGVSNPTTGLYVGNSYSFYPASRQKITQSPETKQTLLLKALFNRGFFLVPWRVYMM